MDKLTFYVRPFKDHLRCVHKNNERYELKFTKPTFKSGRVSVNLWGGFCYHGRTELVPLEGNFDNKKYRAVLDDYLFSFGRNTYGCIQNSVFQEDNIKPHRAIAMKAYLKERGVVTMFWPAQSPDLNPIEDVLVFIKANLRKRTRYDMNEEELFDWVREIWSRIPQSYFPNLVRAMNARAKDVTENRGASTKYWKQLHVENSDW